jgi:hypothetical protein
MRGLLSGLTVMILDTKPKLGKRRQVQERAASGKCLLCDCEAKRLGLCTTHYGRFRTALTKLPENDREPFKARLRREGKLLPSRQGQRLTQVNEFEKHAN